MQIVISLYVCIYVCPTAMIFSYCVSACYNDAVLFVL